jgi:hypothetical protein
MLSLVNKLRWVCPTRVVRRTKRRSGVPTASSEEQNAGRVCRPRRPKKQNSGRVCRPASSEEQNAGRVCRPASSRRTNSGRVCGRTNSGRVCARVPGWVVKLGFIEGSYSSALSSGSFSPSPSLWRGSSPYLRISSRRCLRSICASRAAAERFILWRRIRSSMYSRSNISTS